MDDRFEEIKREISKIFIAEDELHKVKDAMQQNLFALERKLYLVAGRSSQDYVCAS